MFTAVLFVLFQVCLLGGGVISFFFRKRLGGKVVAAVWVGVVAIPLIEGAYAMRWRGIIYNEPPSLTFTSSQEDWRSITIESDRLSAPQVFRSDAKASSSPPAPNTFSFHVMVMR